MKKQENGCLLRGGADRVRLTTLLQAVPSGEGRSFVVDSSEMKLQRWETLCCSFCKLWVAPGELRGVAEHCNIPFYPLRKHLQAHLVKHYFSSSRTDLIF